MRKSGRAPPFDYSLGAYRRDWLGPGAPTAPAGHRLPLLPSSPGGVHEPAPRGTRPSTPLPGKLALAPCRGEEFHPAMAGCGFRAPPAPRVARPLQTWYAANPQVSNARMPRNRSDRTDRSARVTLNWFVVPILTGAALRRVRRAAVHRRCGFVVVLLAFVNLVIAVGAHQDYVASRGASPDGRERAVERPVADY